jgi:hypothetical protein
MDDISVDHADHPRPTIALALGAGGARGLAHIAVLEAFDDLYALRGGTDLRGGRLCQDCEPLSSG